MPTNIDAQFTTVTHCNNEKQRTFSALETSYNVALGGTAPNPIGGRFGSTVVGMGKEPHLYDKAHLDNTPATWAQVGQPPTNKYRWPYTFAGSTRPRSNANTWAKATSSTLTTHFVQF